MQIDERDRQIIQCLIEGLTIKEIPAKVYMSLRVVNRRLQKLKELTGSQTKAQLIHHLHSSGFFS